MPTRMPRDSLLKLAVAVAIPLPALVLRFSGIELSPYWSLLAYGAAIVGAAVLLAWAAETAQLDISGSLAIAVLALIAVLPEYAVDLVFAYTAGHEPGYAQYAAANPASANRPAWSALENRMLRCTVGDEMRDWQDALKDFFANWNGEL